MNEYTEPFCEMQNKINEMKQYYGRNDVIILHQLNDEDNWKNQSQFDMQLLYLS